MKRNDRLLQFPLHLPDTQPVGQRRINLQRFLGIMPAGVIIFLLPGQITQRRHPCGQPDHDDPHIGSHRQQHLSQRLCLRLPDLCGIFTVSDFVETTCQITQSEQLSGTVHKIVDFHTEACLDSV